MVSIHSFLAFLLACLDYICDFPRAVALLCAEGAEAEI
jgi:hypothetical protein